MSWLFSRALVEAFSATTSSAGERCALLNMMPTAQPFLRNDKPMDCSRFSRFGLTCAPLTAERGAALLTWFLAGFPARTSASPAKAPDSTVSVPACGWKWPASFAKWDHALCTWKTRQHSLLEDSIAFSETLPRWGSMRDGELSVQRTSVPPICANESGFELPTPSASRYGSSNNGCPGDGRTEYATKGKPSLDTMARQGMWPTPNVPNGGRSVTHVEDWRGRSAYHNEKKVQVGLEAAVRFWPTPTVCGNNNRKGASADSGDQQRAGGKALNETVGGSLNPTWVEWLMGWPLAWTDCAPLGMDKFQEWRQQHGGC